MEILGIGPLELAFIILIALIVVGPRDLGKTAHTIGRSLNKMYRSDTWRLLKDTSRNLRTLPNRLAREAGLEEIEELKKARESVEEIKKEIGGEIRTLDQDLSAWTTPQTKAPESPPEPLGRESVDGTNEEA
jgi:Sec-independent protein translocase protein TatA